MSLDQAIKHKKEKREKFYGSKSFDSSCRNHGSCPYCEQNRTIGFKKLIEKSKTSVREFTHNEE